MISRLQFSPTTAIAMHENMKLSNSSLVDWMTPSWDKMIRLSNITLLVAGIAAAFFLEIPLAAGGLAMYGVFYFLYLLRGKVKNGSAIDDDAQSLQTGGNVEKGKYQKALKKIEEQRQTIRVLEATKSANEREIADLRRRIRSS